MKNFARRLHVNDKTFKRRFNVGLIRCGIRRYTDRRDKTSYKTPVSDRRSFNFYQPNISQYQHTAEQKHPCCWYPACLVGWLWYLPLTNIAETPCSCRVARGSPVAQPVISPRSCSMPPRNIAFDARINGTLYGYPRRNCTVWVFCTASNSGTVTYLLHPTPSPPPMHG